MRDTDKYNYDKKCLDKVCPSSPHHYSNQEGYYIPNIQKTVR